MLKKHKCMQIGNAVAYRLKYTTPVTLILLPVTSCRDWVRFQESCGLDLMPFAPPAQSNFQDSHSKRVSLLQWGGIRPPAKSVRKGTVQLLHEFAVVPNITASRSGGLRSDLNSGTNYPYSNISLAALRNGTDHSFILQDIPWECRVEGHHKRNVLSSKLKQYYASLYISRKRFHFGFRTAVACKWRLHFCIHIGGKHTSLRRGKDLSPYVYLTWNYASRKEYLRIDTANVPQNLKNNSRLRKTTVFKLHFKPL
jgi:hypothetical protein